MISGNGTIHCITNGKHFLNNTKLLLLVGAMTLCDQNLTHTIFESDFILSFNLRKRSIFIKLSLQSTYLYRSTFDYLPNVHVRLKSSLFYKMNMGHFLLKPFRQFHRENNFVQIESKFVFLYRRTIF